MDCYYCYKNSDVLINKFDIHDADKLFDLERKLTSLRIQELLEFPIQGKFDFIHLKKIHQYIFQDLYFWAGQTRSVNISKGTMFCKMEFIDSQADKIFEQLRKDNYLKNLQSEEMVKKLSYYFSEINALHPFREGNGRTQREFIRELALYNGYILKFDNVTHSEMLEASIASFRCDYEKMNAIFTKCLS